jgi:phosphomannomutase
MPQRILSVSGLRGVIGDGLDADYVTAFAAAVGTWAKGGTVVLSRDGRATGEMVRHAALAGLLATGCKVVDVGVCATPTVGVLVSGMNAAAGLQITASHNPVEWNGLKPFRPTGSVFDEATGKELVAILDLRAFAYKPHDQLGRVLSVADPAAPHLQRVTRVIDAVRIRGRKFKVVLDCNHGSGAVAGPQLLKDFLGCEVTVLGGTPDGKFEHPPEPLEANLGGLCNAVKANGADVGFAQDPDADRLAIVDDTGRYIGEELTLALALDHVLPRRSGPVVVNGSTSRVTADIARKYACAFHRSSVGEAHVVAKMNEVGAAIGGEGNGGVIDPQVGLVRDSFVSMAYVLDGLAARGGTLAEWVDGLPKYTIVKDKVTCERGKVAAACDALRRTFADAEASEGDGLRLDWADRWVQVRASNTEPILRVIAEAPTAEAAQGLCRSAMEAVRGAVG